MESRFSPIINGEKKKRFCDKAFKNSLCKALTVNSGDPDNITKINNSKTLDDYPACRIIDYTNALSNDIQNAIEETIEDPEVQNIIKLAKNIESITTQRADEVKTVTQLLSQSNKTESFRTTGNVDFNSLNKYINSAVSGLPDVIQLDVKSRDVLFETYRVMMEQVNKNATPELLNDLKNAIRFGVDNSVESELSKCFLDPSFNPLTLPFSYLINGVIPDSTNNVQPDKEMEKVEEGNTSNNIASNPENNTQFTPSTSSAIQEEKTPPKKNQTSVSEETHSDKSDDEKSDDEKSEQIKPPKRKKPKVYRRSKRKIKKVY